MVLRATPSSVLSIYCDSKEKQETALTLICHFAAFAAVATVALKAYVRVRFITVLHHHKKSPKDNQSHGKFKGSHTLNPWREMHDRRNPSRPSNSGVLAVKSEPDLILTSKSF